MDQAEKRMRELDALTSSREKTALAFINTVYADDQGESEKSDIETLLQDYRDALARALEKAEEIVRNDPAAQSMLDKFTSIILKHQETLAAVYDRVPDQAKTSLKHAMEASLKHVETVVDIVDKKQLPVLRKTWNKHALVSKNSTPNVSI